MGFKHLPASTEFCELFSQSQRAEYSQGTVRLTTRTAVLFVHAVRVADIVINIIAYHCSVIATAILILIVLVQNYRTNMPTDLP